MFPLAPHPCAGSETPASTASATLTASFPFPSAATHTGSPTTTATITSTATQVLTLGSLRIQIGELNLEIARDQHRAVSRHILEAVARIAIATR